MIPGKDMDTLRKCLALTTSNQDGEALAAIRAANKIVLKHGLTWHDVLGRQEAPQENGWTRSRTTTHDRDKVYYEDEYKGEFIEDMITYLLEAVDLPESMEDFIRSLRKFFEKNGKLSEKQCEALYKTYRRN